MNIVGKLLSFFGIWVGIILVFGCASAQDAEVATGQNYDARLAQMKTYAGLKTEIARYLNRPIPQGGKLHKVELKAAPAQLEVAGASIDTWAYNNQVPGPVIRIKWGDTLQVNLKNDLPQPTTIHWHGVRVPNNMDGVPGVTQPAIQPGESFVYEFVPQDPGTYWFHPHFRGFEQVERGLYGILVVEDPNEPQYDEDIVWVLDDWLLDEDKKPVPPFSDFDKMRFAEGRLGNYLTINGKAPSNLVLPSESRVRIRVVNVSNARNYQLHFPSLDAKVISVDGQPVGSPFEPDNFVISPANRIDVDLKIGSEDLGKQFEVYSDSPHRGASVPDDPPTNGKQLLANIEVKGKGSGNLDFAYPTFEAIPKMEEAYDLPLDSTLAFSTVMNLWGFLFRGESMMHYTINDQVYGKDHQVLQWKENEFYKIRLTNETGLFHPVHIHGVFFKVLTKNGQPANESFLRDTILLDYEETVEIGVVPHDLGSWALHCHVFEHGDLGMMTLVDVVKK